VLSVVCLSEVEIDPISRTDRGSADADCDPGRQ
jgi:hypothetical protein